MNLDAETYMKKYYQDLVCVDCSSTIDLKQVRNYPESADSGMLRCLKCIEKEFNANL